MVRDVTWIKCVVGHKKRFNYFLNKIRFRELPTEWIYLTHMQAFILLR